MAETVNTMYHSMVLRVVIWLFEAQTVWKKIFIELPPIIISVTQVPPDRYIVGNRAKIFPSFSPTQYLINSIRHSTSSHSMCVFELNHMV